jgi:hypothetical protein
MLLQHRVERAEPKARRSVFVLYHHQRDGRIGEQFQELGTTVIDARADLFDYLMNLIALGGWRRNRSPIVPPDSPDSDGFPPLRHARTQQPAGHREAD